MSSRIRFIRKAKYHLFKWGIHNFIPAHAFSFLGHLSYLSKWISKHRQLEFGGRPVSGFDYNRRFDLYKFILDKYVSQEPIDYLEFGVSRGFSFRWWVENQSNPESAFYGFDTFTGLPEDWGPFKKGAMSNGNEPPKMEGSRHQFYQGVFQDTLFKFLKGYRFNKRKVVHLDADLYSSTLFVLTTLSPLLKPNDILLFDEFNVPLHEFKAFKEWSESFYRDYKVLGETNNYYQVAIMLK